MVELDNVFDPKERRRIFSQLLKNWVMTHILCLGLDVNMEILRLATMC